MLESDPMTIIGDNAYVLYFPAIAGHMSNTDYTKMMRKTKLSGGSWGSEILFKQFTLGQSASGGMSISNDDPSYVDVMWSDPVGSSSQYNIFWYFHETE